MFLALCAVFLTYVIMSEIISGRYARDQIAYLSEMDIFLGNLRHNYFKSGSVRDAIYYSTEGIKKKVSAELKEILEILESEDVRTKGTAYLNSGKDKYLRLLMSMALLVEENGDSDNAECGSVFINAVMQLRLEVRDERRHLSGRRHKFMGLTLTAALPLAAVPFISSWGISTNPNMLMFYYGRTGSVFRAVLLIVGFLCYSAVRKLRDSDREALTLPFDIRKKPYRMALFTVFGVLMLASLLLAHSEARHLLINDVSNISMISDLADGRQLKAMEEVIPSYTARYVSERMTLPDMEELSAMLLEEPGIRTDEVAAAAADEILGRVKAYGREKTDITDILIVIAASVAGYFIPALSELFDSALREGRIKDEIMQFQSIICMQKDVPGITPVTILESLERFAKIFGADIRKCLNEYGINDIRALRSLKETQDNVDFRRIADCFLSADELGVKDAFDEVAAEITAFREDRRSDREIILDNDVLLASVISIIPGGIILFGYLLVPFMVSALSLFDTYQSSLKEYISIT